MVFVKEFVMFDVLFGGWVELGIGVGWFKEEFEVLGVFWDCCGVCNDEYVVVMCVFWL